MKIKTFEIKVMAHYLHAESVLQDRNFYSNMLTALRLMYGLCYF